MIHLTQAEYDELVAAKEALAILRDQQNICDYAKHKMPMNMRINVVKKLAEALLSDARAIGLHMTIERQMHGTPSMDRIGYVIEAWPDQRAP